MFKYSSYATWSNRWHSLCLKALFKACPLIPPWSEQFISVWTSSLASPLTASVWMKFNWKQRQKCWRMAFSNLCERTEKNKIPSVLKLFAFLASPTYLKFNTLGFASTIRREVTIKTSITELHSPVSIIRSPIIQGVMAWDSRKPGFVAKLD